MSEEWEVDPETGEVLGGGEPGFSYLLRQLAEAREQAKLWQNQASMLQGLCLHRYSEDEGFPRVEGWGFRFGHGTSTTFDPALFESLFWELGGDGEIAAWLIGHVTAFDDDAKAHPVVGPLIKRATASTQGAPFISARKARKKIAVPE